MESCPIIVELADSPIQQQDGVLPGPSRVGAVEVSSVVVAHRLQQGPQLGVVLSQLGTVDRTTHHAAVGIRLWEEETEQSEPGR